MIFISQFYTEEAQKIKFLEVFCGIPRISSVFYPTFKGLWVFKINMKVSRMVFDAFEEGMMLFGF